MRIEGLQNILKDGHLPTDRIAGLDHDALNTPFDKRQITPKLVTEHLYQRISRFNHHANSLPEGQSPRIQDSLAHTIGLEMRYLISTDNITSAVQLCREIQLGVGYKQADTDGPTESAANIFYEIISSNGVSLELKHALLDDMEGKI